MKYLCLCDIWQVKIMKKIIFIFIIFALVGCTNKTKIDMDVTYNINVEFMGINGEGRVLEPIDKSHIIYDKDNVDIASFIDNIEYIISPNENLYNGEKITVTTIYDNEMAEKLNLNVINSISEVEVDGLSTYIKDKKDIDDVFLEDFQKYTDRYVDKSVNYGNVELDSIYFGKGDQGKTLLFALYGYSEKDGTNTGNKTTMIIYCKNPLTDNDKNQLMEISTNKYDYFFEEGKLDFFKQDIEKNINKKFNDDYYRVDKIK